MTITEKDAVEIAKKEIQKRDLKYRENLLDAIKSNNIGVKSVGNSYVISIGSGFGPQTTVKINKKTGKVEGDISVLTAECGTE